LSENTQTNSQSFELTHDRDERSLSLFSRIMSYVKDVPTLPFNNEEFKEKVIFCAAQLEIGKQTKAVHWQGAL